MGLVHKETISEFFFVKQFPLCLKSPILIVNCHGDFIQLEKFLYQSHRTLNQFLYFLTACYPLYVY